jgi:broad specificity phosphatase PhoE
VARVVTSPLQRCRETTALAFPQAVPEVEDDLGECHYGGWTGRPLAELSALPLWKVVQDDPASAMFPPDASYRAESMQQMATRVLAALRRIDASVSAEHGDGALWAAVSHGDPIKSLVAEAAGAGLGGLQRVRVDPGSVSVIHVVGEKMMLLASNVTDGDLTRFLPSPEQPSEARGTVGGETG